jgi:TPR repeat protein
MRSWQQANRLRLFEGLTARLIAETLLAQEPSDVEEAHQWLEKATAADRASKLKLGLAHDYVGIAEVHRHNADQEQMVQSLTRARDLFEECGAQGFIKEMDRRIGQGTISLQRPNVQ